MRLAGKQKCVEVDHFNLHKKADNIQEYANLFPATRHCNGAKGKHWPSEKDQRLGIRACLKSHIFLAETFEHKANHSQIDHGFAGFGLSFVVAIESA
jgi:hypothetical protein